MTLSDSLAQKYGSAYPTIYLHSSVVVSDLFRELVESILQKKYKFYVFNTCPVELDNYTAFKQNSINERVQWLLKAIKNSIVNHSPYCEYDLSMFNPQVSCKKQKSLVIYGNRKLYSDFTVHCANDDPIDVLLLEKVNNQYLITDSNSLKKVILRSEYNACWNVSKYRYTDVLTEGSVLYYGDGHARFSLGKPISALTGEGDVFKTSIRGVLCKIYKNGVLQKGLIEKLSYVVKSPRMTDRAAWPREIVYNKIGQPIGFLMDYFEGESLSNLMYTWNNSDWLKTVCYAGELISQTVSLFHSQNIIVGDISPRDILLNKKMAIRFIDADSFQYGIYPCPGFMYEYKHKDLNPRLLKSRLRPVVFEYFSLAVVLYEMMMRGHFPNEVKQNLDEITFGDIETSDSMMFNYRTMKFPFSVNGHTNQATDASIKCWQEIPEMLQKLFVDVFTYKRIVSAAEWQKAFAETQANIRR